MSSLPPLSHKSNLAATCAKSNLEGSKKGVKQASPYLQSLNPVSYSRPLTYNLRGPNPNPGPNPEPKQGSGPNPNPNLKKRNNNLVLKQEPNQEPKQKKQKVTHNPDDICTNPICAINCTTSHKCSEHKCEFCNSMGHGAQECNYYDFSKIKDYSSEITGKESLESQNFIYKYNLYKVATLMFEKYNSVPVNLFIDLYIGMGCHYFIRLGSDKDYTKMTGFFLHHDSCGQYGEESNDLPKVCHFIQGYFHVPPII